MSIKNERLLIRAKKLLKKGNVSEARELTLVSYNLFQITKKHKKACQF